jgi:hypothetical protein
MQWPFSGRKNEKCEKDVEKENYVYMAHLSATADGKLKSKSDEHFE